MQVHTQICNRWKLFSTRTKISATHKHVSKGRWTK